MATIIDKKRIRRGLTALAWMSVLLFAGKAMAQPSADLTPGEIEIKAAFVYKFTGYVEWPRSSLGEPDNAITIGVAGAAEIVDELRRIVAGRTVQGRGISIRPVSSENDVRGVHVLFIGADANARMGRLLETARQRPILVITDAPDGLERGAMINFVMVKRRVQFEIAVEPAEKAGLSLSSRLLSVAFRVKKGDLELDVYLAGCGAPLRPSYKTPTSVVFFTPTEKETAVVSFA
jgi:hypothetical protein